MKFLLDANLSPSVAVHLRAASYEAAHVADLALATTTDETICERAARDGYVLITADSDFPMHLRCAAPPRHR